MSNKVWPGCEMRTVRINFRTFSPKKQFPRETKKTQRVQLNASSPCIKNEKKKNKIRFEIIK